MNFSLRYIKGFTQSYPDCLVSKQTLNYFYYIVLYLNTRARDGCPMCMK